MQNGRMSWPLRGSPTRDLDGVHHVTVRERIPPTLSNETAGARAKDLRWH
jgi:hypothetical protein